jgi:hypothetical protein
MRRVGWEVVVVTSITHGLEAAWLSEGGLQGIKIIQNDMARYLTGGSRAAALEGLRGELGWETVRDQMARRCLTYARRYREVEEGDWLRRVGEAMEELPEPQRSGLQRRVRALAGEYSVDMDRPMGASKGWKQYVKRRVKDRVAQVWRQGVQGKSSLGIYRKKSRMGWERYWDGSRAASLLFKARVGDLAIGKRGDNWAGREECPVCGEQEDMPHFILECRGYEEARGRYLGRGGEVEDMNREERTAWGGSG